jgi:hypothetical protein
VIIGASGSLNARRLAPSLQSRKVPAGRGEDDEPWGIA